MLGKWFDFVDNVFRHVLFWPLDRNRCCDRSWHCAGNRLVAIFKPSWVLSLRNSVKTLWILGSIVFVPDDFSTTCNCSSFDRHSWWKRSGSPVSCEFSLPDGATAWGKWRGRQERSRQGHDRSDRSDRSDRWIDDIGHRSLWIFKASFFYGVVCHFTWVMGLFSSPIFQNGVADVQEMGYNELITHKAEVGKVLDAGHF